MAKVFQCPTVQEAPAGFSRLFWRYPLTQSDAILIKNGAVVNITRTPGVDETQDADWCYLGGHRYILTPVEYTLLTGLGYSAYITDEDTP